MLILRDCDGRLTGRALLWKVGGKIYMDTIYRNGDEVCTMFEDYAKENNLILRDKIGGKKIKIKLNLDHKFYPFSDTFYFVRKGYLHNNNISHEDWERT